MKAGETNTESTPHDDIFKTDEQCGTDEIKLIPLSELHPFEEQPFKVLLDESMDELVESVKQRGVLSPIIVRPRNDGGYEIVSGHRRVKACELAGMAEISTVVKNLDDDSAAILLVDSNLQRENILPSEKAFAYQLKLEAMKRKVGRPQKENVSQIGTNFEKSRSDEELAEQIGESRNQIQRYIRLTNLITPLLDMTDEKKIALNAAVELSYLGSKAQSEVAKAIERENTAPSIAQAGKMRQYFQEGRLTAEVIDAVMREQKPEKMKITIGEDKIKKYFPKSYSKQQIENTVMRLIENWYKKRQQEKER